LPCSGDFDLDLDAAEQIWADAMKLPGAADRVTPSWYHGDLAAENLLVQDGTLTAVLDFGGLALGDPTVDLVVAWEVLDPPAREVFRRQVGVDDATWLRGRAWALSISLMIWYYWATMPGRRARCMRVGRNILSRRGLFRVTPVHTLQGPRPSRSSRWICRRSPCAFAEERHEGLDVDRLRHPSRRAERLVPEVAVTKRPRADVGVRLRDAGISGRDAVVDLGE
jgi:hypothetical protein